MAENSKIEWTDHTFNPWIGCQKVSPGCDHCYAEALMDTRWGKVEWGPHGERKRTSDANWKQPRKWDRAAQAAGVRRKVFCASLADWLDNRVPADWRMELAMLINETPHLDWLLLTKRPENYRHLAPWIKAPPANVWLGITAEDQGHYHRRWEKIQDIHATVRFISYEPALGPLMLRSAWSTDRLPHWIICGGESGHGARAMDPNWARDLRDVCKSSGVAFFMKQMTGKKPIPDDLLIREFPRAA
jgi:protein gp37